MQNAKHEDVLFIWTKLLLSMQKSLTHIWS